jgi:hypothetical protein
MELGKFLHSTFSFSIVTSQVQLSKALLLLSFFFRLQDILSGVGQIAALYTSVFDSIHEAGWGSIEDVIRSSHKASTLRAEV